MKTTKFLSKALLIFSLIGLSSCNKKSTDALSYCPTANSTPTSTPEPTPTKTVEELNKELFENYAITTENSSIDGTLNLSGFKDDIPEEYLNLETIIIPEKIGDVDVILIHNTYNGLFSKFPNLKHIKIPSTIKNIVMHDDTSERSSPFVFLPKLESIEVDENNESYYTNGNCLIEKEWSGTLDNKVPKGTFKLVCGWGDVEIPTELTSIRKFGFAHNLSITSIKLHDKVTSIDQNSLKYLDNLNSIDLNNNTYFELKGNVLFKKSDNGTVTTYSAYGDVILPEEITAVKLWYCSSVTSVKLHDKVKIIDSQGFEATKIKTLSIPASVEAIANDAFSKLTDIENITVDPDNKIYYVESNCLINKSNTTPTIVYAWGDVTIPDSITSPSLDRFASVTKVTLPEGVTTLPDNAFRGTKITSLDIPASVTTISLSAFNGLTDITEITIDGRNQNFIFSNGVIFKSNMEFIYAYGDAIIPVDKTTFGSVTLEYCYSLTSLTLHNNITYVNTSSFSNIRLDKFKALNFKGNVTDFKNKVVNDQITLYDLFKKYTTMTVQFMKEENNTWVNDGPSYKMSEIENLN